MLDDQYDYELDDARVCFESVLMGDQNNIEANLELGYYYFSIDEGIEKAQKYSEKAYELSSGNFIESIVANSKLHGEESPEFGLAFLDTVLKVESLEIEVLREELK